MTFRREKGPATFCRWRVQAISSLGEALAIESTRTNGNTEVARRNCDANWLKLRVPPEDFNRPARHRGGQARRTYVRLSAAASADFAPARSHTGMSRVLLNLARRALPVGENYAAWRFSSLFVIACLAWWASSAALSTGNCL